MSESNDCSIQYTPAELRHTICILILSGSNMFRLLGSGITLNRTPWNGCTRPHSSLGFWEHQHDTHCLDSRWWSEQHQEASRETIQIQTNTNYGILYIDMQQLLIQYSQVPATIALHASTLPHMVAMCSGVCPTLSSHRGVRFLKPDFPQSLQSA